MLSKLKDVKKIVVELCKFKADVSEFSRNFQVMGNDDDIKRLYSTLTDRGISCHLSKRYNRILNIDK